MSAKYNIFYNFNITDDDINNFERAINKECKVINDRDINKENVILSKPVFVITPQGEQIAIINQAEYRVQRLNEFGTDSFDKQESGLSKYKLAKNLDQGESIKLYNMYVAYTYKNNELLQLGQCNYCADGGRVYIDCVEIKNEYKNYGIGTVLMQTMLRDIYTKGYNSAYLDANRASGSHIFYQKLGFVDDNRVITDPNYNTDYLKPMKISLTKEYFDRMSLEKSNELIR